MLSNLRTNYLKQSTTDTKKTLSIQNSSPRTYPTRLPKLPAEQLPGSGSPRAIERREAEPSVRGDDAGSGLARGRCLCN